MVEKIKSPSNTTIYMPALNKEITPTKFDNINPYRNESVLPNEVNVVEHINDFVNQMHLVADERRNSERDREGSPSTSRGRAGERVTTDQRRKDEQKRKMNEDQEKANQMILDAEKFRATVSKPTGRDSQLSHFSDDLFQGLTDYLKRMANNNEDDEFFHITCHVEPSLKAKIEKAEFVDLEKLLPRDRLRGSDDQTLTLVNRGGNTFFVPSESGNKITNVRCWEQAFRVYAAVYSNANPSRSAEIWQYVYIINTASSSYVWENIAHYDFTFRQLMHNYPNRSWAKVYNQLWNLAMRDPIPRNNQNNHNHSGNNFSTSFSSGNGSGSGHSTAQHAHHKYGDWRDNCFWRFNRGKCNKWNCPYDYRCNYCGGWNHSSVDCRKKKGKGKKSRSRGSSPEHSKWK